MKITILTQSDPFYLAESIEYLIDNLPKENSIVSAVIFEVSPFGKKESFFQKMIRTGKVFGLRFLFHYGLVFTINLIKPNKSVKHVFNEHVIPIIELDINVNHPDSIRVIKEYKPDLLISIAANQIFEKQLIDLAPKGCINLHSALLPKYRGLMPTFWVLKNGESETGVSVFFVDEGIDSGPIINQKKTHIRKGTTQAELIKQTKKLGMNAIIDSIYLIQEGGFDLMPNSDTDSSYYTFPTRDDVKDFYRAGNKFY